MRRVSVKLKGISALLMHAFPMVEVKELQNPEEQAERAAYRDPVSKNLYIPGVNVQRALVSAANFSKGKGRASLARQAAACLMVSPERISLGTEKYDIDARPVVIPATKGRVIRYRPKLEKWEVEFTLEYDESLLEEKQVRQIMDDACSRVGFLDFRPEKKGPFGRAMVTGWTAQKD